MRLQLHDFTGHPFQVELARELASRGHEVLHLYSDQYVTGRGRLQVTDDDPATLRIEPLRAPRPLDKYHPYGRIRFELSYARVWADRLKAEPFDAVLAANTPLFTLTRALVPLRRVPWVLWHQDATSLAVSAEARRVLPGRTAAAVAWGAQRLERLQVRRASAVVPIGAQFVELYAQWGVGDTPVTVLPNWAPLDDIRPGARDNAWSAANGLSTDRLRLLYAGTLGRKHNPRLLLDLLDGLAGRGVMAELVVCSEGDGADDLAAGARERSDVRLLPFQTVDVFPDVLAAGDVVVALLEPDAALFSVPSKVLSYLASGRPVLGLMPDANPAAASIRAGSGFVSTPDRAGVETAVGWLADLADRSELRDDIGRAARAHAEREFAIGAIADRFERVLLDAVERTTRSR